MNNKVKHTILSIVVMVATLGIFLLLCRNILDTGMCWYTLAIIMLSEGFLSAFWISFKRVPERFAAFLVSATQTLANLLVSIIFLLVFPESYIGYTVFVILSILALFVLAFFLLNNSKEAQKMESSKDFFFKCRLAVNALANSPNGESYRAELLKLEENLRFCNDGLVIDGDHQIYESICELKTKIDCEGNGVLESIKDIENMVRQHDMILKNSRR